MRRRSLLSFLEVAAMLGLAAAMPGSAHAALPEWQHVAPIEVTENTGMAQPGVVVELSIDTQTLIAAGELEADGADLRFAYDCAGDQLVDYWIDPGTLDTTSTSVWVVLDLAASETLPFYMFYGNPNATAASDLDLVFDGPYSATNQVTGGTTNAVASSIRGFRFTANQNLLVTEFGKNEPNGTTRWVTLWNFGAQSMIHQQQVSGPAATYTYGALASPVWLTAGQQYILTIFQGGTDSYYYQSSSQIGQHLTYGDMRYCNSCTQSTFPTLTLSNYHYGYADLRYYTYPNVNPAPTQNPNATCAEDAACDADCSIAECGDGTTNATAGEQCDDGNTNDGDGCSATCVDEGGGATTTGDDGADTGALTTGVTTGDDGVDGPGTSMGDGAGTSGGADATSTGGPDSGGATSGTSGTATGTGGLPFDEFGGSASPSFCHCRARGASPATAAWLLLVVLGLRGRRR